MSGDEKSTNILSLPWEHVLCQKLFPYLTIKETFQLRVLSKDFRDVVDTFFRTTFNLDFSRIAAKLSANAFVIMTHDNLCLKYLTCCNCKGWLTDEILKPVFINNPQLIKIDLTNCSILTNKSLVTIAVSCTDVTTLILKDCHWVSKDSLTGLLVNCRQLQHIDLTGCWNLDDEVISQLIVYCSQIKFLSIAKIYGLTDTTLSVLSHNSPRLQHLNMQGCWRVTNESVRLLGEFCRSLKILQVKDCRGVNEISLARLRARGIKMDVPPPPQARTLSYLHENLHTLNLQI